MRRRATLSLALCAILVAISLAAVVAEGESKPSLQSQPRINLELRDVDIAVALRKLFEAVHRNYSIAPDVTGNVPVVSFKDTPFDDALKNLLKVSGPLVCRADNNVYVISRAKTKSVADIRVNLELTRMDAAEALRKLFGSTGLNYTVPAGLIATIPSVAFKDVPFDEALEALVNSAGLAYHIDNGIYIISRRGPHGVWSKPINVEFKKTPLGEALDTLFKDSGITYTINPSISGSNISAVFKNVTLEEAVQKITEAAGIDCHSYPDGLMHFEKRVRTPVGTAPQGPPGLGASSSGLQTIIVEVKFQNPADIAQLIPCKASVTSTGRLVITGTQQQLDEAKGLIAALDVPPPPVRPVRITVTVSLSIPSAKSRIDLATESVGAEGRPMPLNISSTTVIPYYTEMKTVVGKGNVINQKYANFLNRPTSLTLELTPSVLADGGIGLMGAGHMSVERSIITKLDIPTQQIIAKDFQVAAWAKPGEKITIAAGSADIGQGKISFTVTAVALVEQGCLQNLPPVQESGLVFGGHGDSSPGFPGRDIPDYANKPVQSRVPGGIKTIDPAQLPGATSSGGSVGRSW